MSMTLTPEYMSFLVLISLVAIVVIIIQVRSINKRLKATEAFIRGLIAQTKLPTPTDPALHRAWLARYNELKESPKKTAYMNRLIEVGILNKEGEVIREP